MLNILHKKGSFPLGYFQLMWPYLLFPADLVTITEEIAVDIFIFCTVKNFLIYVY